MSKREYFEVNKTTRSKVYTPFISFRSKEEAVKYIQNRVDGSKWHYKCWNILAAGTKIYCKCATACSKALYMLIQNFQPWNHTICLNIDIEAFLNKVTDLIISLSRYSIIYSLLRLLVKLRNGRTIEALIGQTISSFAKHRYLR